MTSDPRIRASDADRDRVADVLREHHAAGRLTIEEFQDRLDRTYAARTLGELDALLADLPAIDLYQLPIPASQRPIPPRPPAPRAQRRISPAWRAAWASWASVTLLCVIIWMVTAGVTAGSDAYFWPIWVAGPLGAVLLARSIFGAGSHGHAARDDARAHRHDRRDELRQQRHQLRHDLRAARDERRRGPRDPGGGPEPDR